jgi:hypothetical protein
MDDKDEEDDGTLYTIDNKDEDTTSVIVEEGGGRVGGQASLVDAGLLRLDADDGDDVDGSDKGDDYGDGIWEDTYEQEV